MPRAFAVSDLHGCKFLYDQINAFIEPDDIVYFLGDANDRGSNPWELVKLIRANPQWIYIKGNHEQLLESWIEAKCDDDVDAWRLERNGGGYTMEYFLAENYGKEFTNDWLEFFSNLPTSAVYESAKGTIFMSHSGYIDWHPYVRRDYKTRNLLWSREHFNFPWDNSQEQYDYVVHGHTPIPYVMEDVEGIEPESWEFGAYWYADGHKCCIDNGCFYTATTCLLDLNTFDEHIFSMNMEENENG